MHPLAQQLKDKPIAILGMGLSGQGAHALAEKLDYSTTCFDEQEIEDTRQVFSLADAHMHSAAIVTPGMPLTHPWVIMARQAKLPILSELDFGGLFLEKGVWAVTGTNGKTTTCEFMCHTMRSAGKEAVVLGNNGESLCGWLADNFDQRNEIEIVAEISSFQAEKTHYLPIRGLLWTTFSENHLDYHNSLNDYFGAKLHLANDLLKGNDKLFVCGKSVFDSAVEMRCELPDYTLVVSPDPINQYDTLPEGTPFDHRPFDEDFRLAATFGEHIGIPKVIWHESARTFTLPAHRLSLSTQIGEVAFYNDAKSTTFESTLAAIDRFSQSVMWIGGGKSKGGDLENFARRIAPKLKEAFLIGQTSEKLAILLRRQGIPAQTFTSLDHAVQAAWENAKNADVILFSPGFSSLDDFESFKARGNFFEKAVFELQQSLYGHTKA